MKFCFIKLCWTVSLKVAVATVFSIKVGSHMAAIVFAHLHKRLCPDERAIIDEFSQQST